MTAKGGSHRGAPVTVPLSTFAELIGRSEGALRRLSASGVLTIARGQIEAGPAVRAIVAHEVALAVSKSKTIERKSRQSNERALFLRKEMERHRELMIAQYAAGEDLLKVARMFPQHAAASDALSAALTRLRRLLEEQ